ncbi:aminoglycoside 3-N-acetyltransferase [Deinobacterium chartae]|uniref:Aminoglycoside N(3)-acetyltransferase n=1 Tax=Deinobacterium chartae TaxID=521158 RepID=A0A841I5Y8_9DEIO|nr:aminoglycoside 3-N-acetyltransferase [Deinobacterium chartae]
MLNLFRRAVNVRQSDLEDALALLGLDGSQHVIAHASLSAFGHVEGGAPAMLRALRNRSATLVMPAFSYYTLVWPEQYRAADWPRPTPSATGHFHRYSRVSSDIGRVPLALVDDPVALRSDHPALSFVATGERAAEVLAAQSLECPYAPIGALYDLDGYVLLMGVDHKSNTTVHYGEYLAGQVLLPRYVRVGAEVRETFFPNCSAAFDRLAPYLEGNGRGGRTLQLERGRIGLYPVREVVDATVRLLQRDPEALLCRYASCRCQEVRARVRKQGLHPRSHRIGPAALLGKTSR